MPLEDASGGVQEVCGAFQPQPWHPHICESMDATFTDSTVCSKHVAQVTKSPSQGCGYACPHTQLTVQKRTHSMKRWHVQSGCARLLYFSTFS